MFIYKIALSEWLQHRSIEEAESKWRNSIICINVLFKYMNESKRLI